MNKAIVIIIAMLFALALGAGSVIFLLKNPMKAVAIDTKRDEPTQNLPLDERTVNLADRPDAHFLRLTSVLVVSGDGDIDKASKDLTPQLMDKLIEVLSKEHYEVLLTPEGKESLKKKLTEGFNDALKDKGWTVHDVLFTDFVME